MKDLFSLIDLCNSISKYENKKQYESQKIFSLPEPYFSIKKVRETARINHLTDTAEVFCKQAKLLHHLNDETLDRHYYFFNIKVLFSELSNQQIIYYIKWRTQIRKGVYYKTSYGCLLLYISEIINLIEYPDPKIAFLQLCKFVEKYLTFDNLDTLSKELLIKSLREFWIFYNSEINEDIEFINKITEKDNKNTNYLQEFYDKKYILPFHKYDNLSSYKITNSKFFTDKKHRELFVLVIPDIFNNIFDYCEKHNISIKKELFGSKYTRMWLPFVNCSFGLNKKRENQIVIISDYEQYVCNNNTWTKITYQQPYNYKKLFAYIFKKTEEILRKKTSYKTKITTNKTNMIPILPKGKDVFDFFMGNQLDKIILDTILEKSKNYNKKEYSFNAENILKIKDITVNNEDKLIVEDYTEELKNEEKIQDKKSEIFNTAEIEFLQSIIQNTNNITDICKNHNIPTEIMIDNINEKFYDIIGDNIIESIDNIEIYEDYIEDVKNYLKEENLID